MFCSVFSFFDLKINSPCRSCAQNLMSTEFGLNEWRIYQTSTAALYKITKVPSINCFQRLLKAINGSLLYIFHDQISHHNRNIFIINKMMLSSFVARLLLQSKYEFPAACENASPKFKTNKNKKKTCKDVTKNNMWLTQTTIYCCAFRIVEAGNWAGKMITS